MADEAAPTRAALYARRSTIGQEESLETQLALLDAEARARGWIVQGRYRDTVSGSVKAKDRPAFRQLLGALRRGDVQLVAVAHFDRLGRDMRDMVGMYNLFRDHGVAFCSLAEPFLNSNPDDEFNTAPLIASILSWVSEYNRRQILKRTAEGRAQAKARGVKFGRPQIEVDRSRLFALRTEGLTLREIAREVGVSVGKVHRELQRANWSRGR